MNSRHRVSFFLEKALFLEKQVVVLYLIVVQNLK